MRTSILLLVLSTAFFSISSCTSAYKTGQTPDDVYFSPASQHDEYVRTKERDESKYQSEEEFYDDRYVRMKVRDRRWAYLDDDYYYNRRYSYSYYNCWGSNPWTPYSYWNYTYNPYGSCVVFNSKSTVYSAPRIYNLNSYNSNQIVNHNYSNPKVGSNNSSYNSYNQQPVRVFNNNNSSNSNSNSNINSNSGNFLRNIFGGSGNSNSSSGNSSSNNSSSSSPSSSNSNSSSGSSAPVRKF
jgi:hypothetical protein